MTLPRRHALVGLVLALTVVSASFAAGPADEAVSTTHEGHDGHDSSDDDGFFLPGPGADLVLVVVGLASVVLRRRG